MKNVKLRQYVSFKIFQALNFFQYPLEAALGCCSEFDACNY